MIEIRNLTRADVDEKLITLLAKKVLKSENRKIEELSIVFVGEKKIKELNKAYRKKDKPTDVLSFGNGLNEIFICLSVIKANAKKYGASFESELKKILVHGILHILGYQHGDKMEERQNKYAK